MNRVSRQFRKYHRQIAIILAIPLIVTVITGMAYSILGEWFQQYQIAAIFMSIHTGRIVGLQGIYPILNGLGLAGLLVTGLSMTSLFRRRSGA